MPVRTHPRAIGWLAVRLAALALLALALLPATPAAAARGREVARIRTSKDNTVYVQIQRNRLRVAADADGLRAAKPVKAVRSTKSWSFTYTDFPEIELPAAANEGPKVKATFQFRQRRWGGKARGVLSALISVARTDEENAEWVYALTATAATTRAAADAPVIDAATDAPLTIEVTPEILRSGRLGVGVSLQAGNPSRTTILKNGKPVPTQVSIVDAAGKTIASAEGTLDEFGFL